VFHIIMRIIVVAVVILSCCFMQDVSGTSLRRATPTSKERDEALAKEIARLKERQNSVKMHFSKLMGVLQNDNQKAAKATAQVAAPRQRRLSEDNHEAKLDAILHRLAMARAETTRPPVLPAIEDNDNQDGPDFGFEDYNWKPRKVNREHEDIESIMRKPKRTSYHLVGDDPLVSLPAHAQSQEDYKWKPQKVNNKEPADIASVIRKLKTKTYPLVGHHPLVSLPAHAQSQEAAALEMLKEVCKKPLPTDPNKWNGLKGMAHVLNLLDAPYNIHGGTVLGLVRSCSIFDSDVDFVVEHSWLKSNLNATVSALYQAGFSSGAHFGQPDKVGYERSFHSAPFYSLLDADGQRSNLKAQFETGLATSGSTISLFNRAGVKVDLFTIVREPDDYEWGLWIKGGRCPCTTKSTGTVDFSWLGVNVKVPVPLEDVLTSLYGPDYMTPRKWTWNVEPFTIGSCRHDASAGCGLSK